MASVEDLLKDIDAAKLRRLLDALSTSESARTSPSEKLNEGEIYLRVGVVTGRAFVGELAEGRTSDLLHEFQVHLALGEHRGSTARVPCGVDPQFASTVLVPLGQVPRSAEDWARLLDGGAVKCGGGMLEEGAKRSSLAHLSLTRQRAGSGSSARELVATATVDWRHALLHDGIFAVELVAAGPDSVLHGSAGLLHLRLEVEVGGSAEEEVEVPFTKADIDARVKAEEARSADAARSFYLYARRWWQEFTSIDPLLSQRRVSLFAADEAGAHRSVCSFVSPIDGGRLLASPQHAARFVALFPFERSIGVGGKRNDAWTSLHAFLARRAGDVEDHACLLCSLLLGFGLDAYVCVGTVAGDLEGEEREHAWVCTFGTAGATGTAVSFWEPLTGARYSSGQRRAAEKARSHPYLSLGCLFSDKDFFANKQRSDRVSQLSWDLTDSAMWKHMSQQALAAIPRPGPAGALALVPPAIHPATEAERVESRLRALVGQWREERGLKTLWDSKLSFAMQPALYSYEQERVSGVGGAMQDFDDAVRRAVPRGHVFKGYPTCFTHRDAQRMFEALLQADASRDILGAQGDHVRFALRALVCVYPEDVCSSWLMIATRYLPVGEG